MSYRTETTGAIDKALAELDKLAAEQKSIANQERLENMALNALAELDRLHHDNNFYVELLAEIQRAITFNSEEEAALSPYGLPIPVAQKLYRTLKLHQTDAAAEHSLQRTG